MLAASTRLRMYAGSDATLVTPDALGSDET
jgi:hypothetical protein